MLSVPKIMLSVGFSVLFREVMGSNLMWDCKNQQNCLILHGAQKDKLGKTMQSTERQAWTKLLRGWSFNISQCSSLRFWATIGSARLHLKFGDVWEAKSADA